VFAVGDGGAVLRNPGSAWIRDPTITAADLHAVHGSADDDVVAVGDAGTLLHWNGATWAPIRTTTAADLRGVWATGDRIVAVGRGGEVAILLRR